MMAPRRSRVLAAIRRLLLLILAGMAAASLTGRSVNASDRPDWLDHYRQPASRLIGEALSDTFAWRRLSILTDSIGPRLSGSPQLERAIQWAVDEMRRDGLENVHTEKVMVPKWVRGGESAEIVEPARQPIVMLGLGGSVATPRDGVQAEVFIVRSFEEVDAKWS